MDDIIKYILQKNINYNFYSFKIKSISEDEIGLRLKRNSRITIVSNDLDECIKNRAFTCVIDEKNFRLVLNSDKSRAHNYEMAALDLDSGREMFPDIYINKNFFFEILKSKFSSIALDNSKNYLSSVGNQICAKDINYKKIFFLWISIILFLSISLPKTFLILASTINVITIFFKIYLSIKALLSRIYEPKLLTNKKLNDEEYPIYTILFPLYKEVNKISQIINVIKSINYPKEKLDVKIIIEEDDYMIIREANSVDLHDCVQIVKVPQDEIKTKPKALNYASSFAFGEYITVYDAEDIPDPNQLIDALSEFDSLPDEYICVQSKLDFYNENENFLTKLISLEYKIWFNLILEGLSVLGLPVTLGGTSNHFKFKKLKEIGMWDAYNVTEDAELGLRIYAKGYKTKVIDSLTLEEAPIELGLWFDQRVRWIKGFYQTFLTYLKYKNSDLSKLKIRQKISIWILVYLNTFAFAINPISFLVYVVFAFGWMKDFFYFLLLFGLFSNIFTLILVYLFFPKKSDKFVLSKIKKTHIFFIDCFGIIAFSFYFILHSSASLKAIHEIIFKPFRWNKTTHGLSKIFFKNPSDINYKK